MARRIRWQILIAAVSALLVLGIMSYQALKTVGAPKPLAGGDFIEAVYAAPRQLNPLVSDPASDPTAADMQSMLFDGLFRIGSDGQPEPALAERVDLDESGEVYTITLRSGVNWHDGVPLTSDDVVFTLRALQSNSFGGDPVAHSVWRDALIDKIDDRQLRVRLPEAFAPLLSHAIFPILPSHLLSAVPPDQWATTEFSRKPIGTGPYQLSELSAERALLKANPNYYLGRPFMNSVELRFFPGQREAWDALASGEVTSLGLPRSSDVLPPKLPDHVISHTLALDSYSLLTFNLRDAPLRDQGLRRALAIAIDKDALIAEVLGGTAQRIDTPILPGGWAGGAQVRWYDYDKAQAADLLTSLGYLPDVNGTRMRDGKVLTLPLLTDTMPDHVAVAEAIAKQLGELGVTVEVEPVDPATLTQRLKQHRFTMALNSWQRVGSDPDMLDLWHSSRAASGPNYAGLSDPEIDTYLDSARQDIEPESRQESYNAFQRRWIELAPSIALYQPLYSYLTNDQLKGPRSGDATSAGAPLIYGREDCLSGINSWSLRSAREINGDLRQDRSAGCNATGAASPA